MPHAPRWRCEPWPAGSWSWTPRPDPPGDPADRTRLAARPARRAGVGPIVAATVLGAWSHPGRCRTDAAFAMLGGAAPIPASSGQTVRHRLNRSGDRQLNRALHTIVLTRLRYDPATRAYAKRRRAQGKTDREISAASTATSPASSTDSSKPNQPLTQHRWHVSGTPSARCGTLAASDRNGGSQRRSRWPS